MEIEAARSVSVGCQTTDLFVSLRVIKSFPLFDGEEFAELGIPESNSLAASLVGKKS